MKNGSQLFGRIGGVPFIEHVHYREHIHRHTIRIERINVVREGDKANVVHRKNVINILTDHNVITSETAHILAEYQIDIACFSIFEQSLHTWSVERSSAYAVIDVNVIQRPAVFVDIVREYSFLVLNREGLALSLIITGKSQVHSHFIFGLLW